MRTTKKDIYAAVKRINTFFGQRDYYLRMRVEWAYGRPRAYLYTMNDRLYGEVSPRLSTGPMLMWLEAFYRGIVHGYAAR